jgi:peroxiredoxin Q/BCP
VILGVSPDSAASHRKFKEKHQLPFTLVVDEDHAIAEAYGVWVEKTNYGRKYWGNARTTFVVAPDGRIARIFEKVKPEEHPAEVAEAIASLR